MLRQKIYKYPAVIAIAFLVLAILPLPYAYYTLLRVVITAIAIYYVWIINKLNIEKSFWFWTLIVIIIIYNPLVPIYLYSKLLWGIIDIAAGIFFIALLSSKIYKIKISNK